MRLKYINHWAICRDCLYDFLTWMHNAEKRGSVMSDSKKCDRCGAFYDAAKCSVTFTPDGFSFHETKIDLCPTCKGKFLKWLNKKQVVIGDEQ